jgi:hypothetical protein
LAWPNDALERAIAETANRMNGRIVASLCFSPSFNSQMRYRFQSSKQGQTSGRMGGVLPSGAVPIASAGWVSDSPPRAAAFAPVFRGLCVNAPVSSSGPANHIIGTCPQAPSNGTIGSAVHCYCDRPPFPPPPPVRGR